VATLSSKPYLGAEADNDYIGWFNTNGSANEVTRGSPGGQMEATIDLATAFGGLPETIHLAALAYQSADSGTLASQAPAPTLNDGNVDPDEYLSIPLEALRDEDANGIFDRLEPNRDFVVTRLAAGDENVQLTWKCFPGRTYRIEFSNDLQSDSWASTPDSMVTAGPSDLTLTANLDGTAPRRFFRVALLP
jgi:hypothetical protein